MFVAKALKKLAKDDRAIRLAEQKAASEARAQAQLLDDETLEEI